MEKLENKSKVMFSEELSFIREQDEDRSDLVKKYLEQLKNAEIEEGEYLIALKDLMYIVSHKMRHSLCKIVGLLNIYNDTKYSRTESSRIVDLIRELAINLDDHTREITDCIHEARVKLEIKEARRLRESI
jgi:predicted nucleic acid-binding protein